MSFDASVLDRLGLVAGLALSIKATVVLAIGAAAAWLLRRRSAAARHFVWLLTLNAVLGVTALATLPRGLAVAVPRWPQWAAEGCAALPSVVPCSGVGDVPALSSMVAHEATGVTRGAGGHGATALATGPLPTGPLPTGPLATGPLATRPAALVSPGSLLVVLWLAGTCLVLGWLALGHAGLARIARRSEAVEDPVWRTLLRRLAHEAGVAQAPRLRSSAAVGAPLVCGLLRPSILLPVEAGSWGPEQRRVVLLHELAHIARRDPLSQSIAWLACATYWFQPAAWLAFARLRAEGERACDDRVLSSGVAAPDYASHLLSLARRARALRLASAVSVAMARRSTLEGRLLALLDDGVRRGALGVRARGAGVAALAVVLVALGLVRPVPPEAAVAPAVSSEPGPAAVPAANPSQAPAAHRAEAIRAEPAAGLATNPFAAPAVNPSAAPAPDPFAAPAAARAGAGAAVAQSVVETFDVAGAEAEAGAEPIHADQPARLGDTLALDLKKRAASTRPPATLRSLPVLLASAPAAGHASAAGAATWNNRAGGLWSNPANWTPPDVPDSLGESAVLPALSGAYQVTLDINPAIDALQIDAGDPTLDLNGFSIAAVKLVTNSGTIRNFTGTYDSKRIRNLAGGTLLARADDVVQATGVLWNAGTIVVGPGEHSMLDSPGGLWLQGGGTLVLNATRMADPTGGGLTIDAGTAVRGSGVIEKSVDNLGVVEGDGAVGGVLRIDGLLFNTGTVRVIHGGTVNVNRPLVQNTGGTITSARGGGTFSVMMPREVGGTLNNMRGGGRIVADGGDLMVKCGSWLEGTVERGQGGGAVNIGIATLQNVTVAAGAELGVTGHADLMAAGTALTNNGTVRVSGTVNFGIYNGDYQIYLGGKGVMVLEGGTLGSGTGAILVNRAGQTIQGCGTINPPFINEGTVDLNCGPQPARLPGSFVNRGRLRVLRGNLSIGGTPGAVATNRGTISAAGGAITLEKGATLDSDRGQAGGRRLGPGPEDRAAARWRAGHAGRGLHIRGPQGRHAARRHARVGRHARDRRARRHHARRCQVRQRGHEPDSGHSGRPAGHGLRPDRGCHAGGGRRDLRRERTPDPGRRPARQQAPRLARPRLRAGGVALLRAPRGGRRVRPRAAAGGGCRWPGVRRGRPRGGAHRRGRARGGGVPLRARALARIAVIN
ncbi:MAG: M56 family metallopeptidase [Candidatus Eisenbacteria bacterium]|uniref:M56 family metallopeptidase n=1 Tax=Eiseniibacteriota bacterium TaxID=2212470 RepID=A0A538T4D5_UNCEI|nr:MAG: M56 family metallopeptidase [Candidatus Eisenbacteria bacterium]